MRSARFRPLVAIAAVSASLFGCTSPNCDPDQAGFITGLGNTLSGCYARNINNLQGELGAAKASADIEGARAAAAATRRDRANADLAEAQSRLVSVDQTIAIMQGQLNAARQRAGVSQAALDRAQAAITAARQQRDAVGPSSDPATIKALQGATERSRETQRRLLELIDH